MNRDYSLILKTFVVVTLLALGPAEIDAKPESDVCQRKRYTEISQHELSQILKLHKQWMETKQKEGEKANLCNLMLDGIDLEEAKLSDVDLSGAWLQNANLRKAHLWGADLREAYLRYADMREANLYEASLQGVDLAHTDLSGASLRDTDLRNALLFRSKLRGSDLFEANLAGVLYEPMRGFEPNVDNIAYAKNISKLQFFSTPRALVDLRDAFKRAGMRQQERAITYAIKHSEILLAWGHGAPSGMIGEQQIGKLESVLNYVFFELTTE